MSGLRILIVDSDAKMLKKLQSFLHKRDFLSTVCSTTQDAIRAMGTVHYDLIMVEAEMADGAALDICAAARTLEAVPELMLMISSKTRPESLELFSVERTLKKPFSGRELLGACQDVARLDTVFNIDDEGPERGQTRIDANPAGAQAKAAAPNEAPKEAGKEPSKPPAVHTIMQKVGSLEQTPFASLLYKLFANQDTGVLTVHRAGHERVIFFDQGEPVYALSNDTEDSLGAVLVNNGELRLSDLNTVLKERREGQPLGEALIERGLISTATLIGALDRQVYERVLGCFAFVTGRYAFNEDTQWKAEVKHLRQNPIELICDGVHRFVGPNVLATHLQPFLSRYVVRTEKFEVFLPHFPPKDVQRGWLELLDGTRTLQSLTVEVNRDLMGLLRLVYSLYRADMVDFLTEARTTAERSPHKPALPTRPPTLLGGAAMTRASTEPAQTPERVQTEVDERLTQQVLSHYVRLGYENHWQLLGVADDAGTQALKEAHNALQQRFSPQSVGNLDAMVQEKAAEVRSALKVAYKTLSEPRSKVSYTGRLEMRRRSDSKRMAPVRQIPEGASGLLDIAVLEDVRGPAQDRVVLVDAPTAENPDIEAVQNMAMVELRRARTAASENRWKEAYRHIKHAHMLSPNGSEIVVFQAWIIYNLPHKDRQRQYKVCRGRIEAELAMKPAMADAHVFLGRMCEDHGELDDALDHFQAALLLDEEHAEALCGVDRIWSSLTSPPTGQDPNAEATENLMVRLKGWLRHS